jgi:hypothetical protein
MAHYPDQIESHYYTNYLPMSDTSSSPVVMNKPDTSDVFLINSVGDEYLTKPLSSSDMSLNLGSINTQPDYFDKGIEELSYTHTRSPIIHYFDEPYGLDLIDSLSLSTTNSKSISPISFEKPYTEKTTAEFAEDDDDDEEDGSVEFDSDGDYEPPASLDNHIHSTNALAQAAPSIDISSANVTPVVQEAALVPKTDISSLNTTSSKRTATMRARKLKKNLSKNGPWVCDVVNPKTGAVCNKRFSRSYDLVRHQDTIHAKVRKTFKCHLCGDKSKTFSRTDALSRHLRVKH